MIGALTPYRGINSLWKYLKLPWKRCISRDKRGGSDYTTNLSAWQPCCSSKFSFVFSDKFLRLPTWDGRCADSSRSQGTHCPSSGKTLVQEEREEEEIKTWTVKLKLWIVYIFASAYYVNFFLLWLNKGPAWDILGLLLESVGGARSMQHGFELEI